MSSEPEIQPPTTETPDESGEKISKKAAKKEAAKLEKQRRRQEQEEAARKTASLSLEDESSSRNYGDVTLTELQSTADPKAGKWREAVEGKKWTNVSELVEEIAGSEVLIRGRVHTNRPVSNKLGFVILRQSGFTVQCVVTESKERNVSVNMVKFLKQLSGESFVDVIGVVVLPKEPLTGTTQQVEIQVRRVYCVNSALQKLPLNVEDAARSEADIQAGKPGANQDTRLNNRVIDLRTPANQAIFRIQCHVQIAFREFLLSKGFLEIHTPKLIAGSSEGGAAVFRLEYKGQPACLAQSPQLHKQMAICGDLERVFEVGAVYRAEDSFTHRHLCEFIGLDVEMAIHKHYSEVMDIVGELFPFIFTKLEERCSKELEAIRKQYPFQPLKFLPKTLTIPFAEGIQMLKEAGVEADPLGDLNTEVERKLGQLVLEKYNTEFYILHRYPSAVRPFYTMPCADDSNYSNSFDVFIRGEEIISGAQRVHDPELLKEQAIRFGIDVDTIKTYIDSFRYGAPPAEQPNHKTLAMATKPAKQSVQCFGRKKTAVAVTHCKPGCGLIKLNGSPIELFQPEILRFKIFEPVLLLGKHRFAGVDMRIRVNGGGHTSQVYAIRQSIAKALVAFYQKYVDEQSKKEVKDILIRYDRTLLVADPRRCEPKKFGGRGARSRFQKSYR